MAQALMSLTHQQRRAIEARDVSVALSAGAGCGKTFVLTERFVSHLVPDQDASPAVEPLGHLIAITFTDRAAREMRDRIRAKCSERLESAAAEQVDYWLRLLRSLDTARVSTIHAFCGALLRSHAVEAGLDPQFTVIEQTQADTVLAELIEDVLRETLSDADDALHKAVLDLTTLFGLERLQTMIGALLGSGREIDFAAWLKKDPEELVSIWDRYRSDTVVPSLLGNLALSPACQSLLDVVGHLHDAGGELRKRCDALSRLLPELPNSRHLVADLDSIVEHARVQGTGSKKSWPDETLYDRFKTAAEKLRDEAKRIKRFLAVDSAGARADAEAGLQLLAVAQAVNLCYEKRKRELACLDFNDLLIRACWLLTKPEHAQLQERLAAQVRLLLVDECQDTDPVQVELIKALCGPRFSEGKLFFVGDYKQSI